MTEDNYQLHVRRCLDKDAGDYIGTIVSGQLDPRIRTKKEGAMDVLLTAYYKGTGRGILTVDKFLLDSIGEFIEKQESVVDDAEAALFESCRRREAGIDSDIEEDFDSVSSPEDVWGYTRFIRIEFRRKNIITDEQIKSMTDLCPNLDPDSVIGDDPDATSAFALVFDCKWDDEHDVKVEYADGKCLGAFLE